MDRGLHGAGHGQRHDGEDEGRGRALGEDLYYCGPLLALAAGPRRLTQQCLGG